jgi:hypothetical protein
MQLMVTDWNITIKEELEKQKGLDWFQQVNGGKSSGYNIGDNVGLSRDLEIRRLHLIDPKSLFFLYGSTALWGPGPPHFSRLHDHTL